MWFNFERKLIWPQKAIAPTTLAIPITSCQLFSWNPLYAAFSNMHSINHLHYFILFFKCEPIWWCRLGLMVRQHMRHWYGFASIKSAAKLHLQIMCWIQNIANSTKRFSSGMRLNASSLRHSLQFICLQHLNHLFILIHSSRDLFF